jgi:transposase
VAEALLVDEKTVGRYVERYRQDCHGEFWLMDYHGSEPKLTETQMRQLDTHLQGRIYLTVAGITSYVSQTFGVTYSEQGMTNLLHRLEFTYKKPKVVPGKADAEAQRDFLKSYQSLKKRKDPGDPIYFMDGVHPQHNTVAACGWIKKGHTQTIPSNTGRQRLNLNGVVNIESMQVVVRSDETLDAASTIALFETLEKKHPQAGRIYVIADNARYYRSRLVKTYLKRSRIKLKFLPPYAPNLNLIERLWKYFRKKVLYNRYYGSFAEFKRACLGFFANIKDHRAALRTLLTENFEIIAAA